MEFLTNEHGRAVVADASGSNPVVSLLPPVETACCNDAAPLGSTTFQLAIAENELDRLSPVRCQGVVSSGPFCSIEQTGVSAQQTIEEPPILQIPESTVHPERLQDFFSERIPSTNLRGTGIQQLVGSADSPSSTVHTIVPAQHRILDVAAETGPSNHNITDNTLNPSTSQEDVPSERATSEHLRSTGVQLDQGNQLFPNFMSASWAPAQAFFADPFQNELFRIRKQNDSCSKKHEDKKVLLQVEFEREIEKLRRKYDSLLQDAEREHLRDKKMFQAIYDKVLLHKVFAEEVRFKFYDHKEGMSTPFRGPSLNLSQQLQTTLTTSQPQLPFRPSSIPPSIPPSTTSHPAPLNINQDSTLPLPTSIRPRTRMPSPSPNHLTGPSSHASPVFLSNAAPQGTPPRASLQVGRSPAPHLQRFRPSSSIPTSSIPHAPSTNQQSLPACQVSTSSPSVDLGSVLPLPLISTQPSIPQSCLNSQPANSRPSPPFSSSPVDQSTQDMEADLLESLLLNLPAMSNEFSTSSAVDPRPNASPDIFICLSDDD